MSKSIRLADPRFRLSTAWSLSVFALGLFLAGCGGGQQTPDERDQPTTGTGTAGQPGATPAEVEEKVIGFSQCTTTEPWRVLFNELLITEAAKMSDVNLIVLDAQDKTEKQVADMQTFINREVDAILISPKEAPGLTGVVERATQKGIPVVVLDRDVLTDKYAAFVGGDNMEIGREAGRFAVEALGGAGKAKGLIYEIWGGMASTPAQERHNGFHEIVGEEAGIEVIGNQDGDWKQEKGYDILETALKTNKNIDLVYAHNDPMAFGAYLAAKDAGVADDMMFVGIDALPKEGCVWVKEGQLDATFVYPPPGVPGLEVALDILEGNPPEQKKILLPTKRITKENVDEYLASLEQ